MEKDQEKIHGTIATTELQRYHKLRKTLENTSRSGRKKKAKKFFREDSNPRPSDLKPALLLTRPADHATAAPSSQSCSIVKKTFEVHISEDTVVPQLNFGLRASLPIGYLPTKLLSDRPPRAETLPLLGRSGNRRNFFFQFYGVQRNATHFAFMYCVPVVVLCEVSHFP